ncbi:hypothetical protein TSOC_010421 [Tetrabaena socialis]|uniref:Uncharacterized protein n=1 Tax=Tetrabaena socialis TaxID=47790 RepID=A0A2J7ZTB3_9CHLO|nr:hypothetical protein TSOC_010421 [Tetrabaena socialis]|eukprot:PNH03517.1 hypothetical protein TSOC_010421 [Tetrabaena socialis]
MTGRCWKVVLSTVLWTVARALLPELLKVAADAATPSELRVAALSIFNDVLKSLGLIAGVYQRQVRVNGELLIESLLEAFGLEGAAALMDAVERRMQEAAAAQAAGQARRRGAGLGLPNRRLQTAFIPRPLQAGWWKLREAALLAAGCCVGALSDGGEAAAEGGGGRGGSKGAQRRAAAAALRERLQRLVDEVLRTDLQLWACFVADPLVSESALEVLEALARTPPCLRPLAQEAMPVIAGIVQQPAGQPEVLVRGCLVLLAKLVRPGHRDVAAAVARACFCPLLALMPGGAAAAVDGAAGELRQQATELMVELNCADLLIRSC